jgi:hypothetical protein
MHPKDFFAAASASSPVPGTCFVIMPFAKAFDCVFSVIQESMNTQLGFTCIRTDELRASGNIIESILQGIANSELIVADLTDRNANVYYELGLAHTVKSAPQVILLSQMADEIPFDLRSYRHIVYAKSTAGLSALGKEIALAGAAAAAPIHRIFLDKTGRGTLARKLMGADHCLYEFVIEDSSAGHEAAKFLLRVRRFTMAKKPKIETVFHGGLGLMLGEVRPVPDLPWDIAYERVLEATCCFRIAPQMAPPPARKRPAGRRPAARG